MPTECPSKAALRRRRRFPLGKGLASRRERAARRGAILVEALIVIPFFILAFTGIKFFFEFHYRRMTLHQNVRSQVLARTVSGCRGGVNEPMPLARGVDGTSQQKFAGVEALEVYTRNLGTLADQANANVTASQFMGGFQRNPRASYRVMCNEVAADADLFDVTKKGWSNVTGW